jgi:hypothetical protein
MFNRLDGILWMSVPPDLIRMNELMMRDGIPTSGTIRKFTFHTPKRCLQSTRDTRHTSLDFNFTINTEPINEMKVRRDRKERSEETSEERSDERREREKEDRLEVPFLACFWIERLLDEGYFSFLIPEPGKERRRVGWNQTIRRSIKLTCLA